MSCLAVGAKGLQALKSVLFDTKHVGGQSVCMHCVVMSVPGGCTKTLTLAFLWLADLAAGACAAAVCVTAAASCLKGVLPSPVLLAAAAVASMLLC
jgi:hypothetical protein